MADQSIVQRTVAALRYAFTGSAPADWFGPSDPLPAQAPPSVAGRQFDYPFAANITFRPRAGERTGFDKLKALARYDIARLLIERRKDKLEALTWSIKVKPVAGKKPKEAGADVAAIQAQLEFPDRIHDWGQWVRALVEQNDVLDAVSIYRRRDRAGRPWSFELLDGATIKPLIDTSGRQPAFPDAAYQQVLKGLPAVDYTTAELLYFPQNFRSDHVYGYSRIEQVVDFVETAIERLKSQKAFFTHGNLSDGYFEAPQGATPDQVRQVEQMWNNLLSTGVEQRRINQFLPAGFKWNAIGQPPLQEAFDEWLARIICFAFSTAPTPFLKQQGMGHGSAKTDHDAAEESGLGNTMAYITRVMNRLLAEDFARPDLEFAFDNNREFDPQVANDIQDKKLRNGSLTLDEARDADGKHPLPDGQGAKPLIYTATGAVTLEEVLDPPAPPPVMAPFGHPSAQLNDNEPDEDGKAGSGKSKPGKPTPAAMAKAAPAAHERRLGAALNRYFAAKAKVIIPLLSSRLAKAEDGYQQQINDAFEEIDWDWSDLAPMLQPGLAGVATGAGKRALTELKLFDADVLARMTANATDYAKDRAAEMVGRTANGDDNDAWSIPDATRNMLRTAVTDAMQSGASNDELAAAIRQSDTFSKNRATTIARTETGKADVEGARAGWRASGVVAGREWMASDGCCDECQALDGVIVPLDGSYPNGADCPLHPNCECAEGPVLPEDMPDGDDDLGKAYSDDQPRDERGRWSADGGLTFVKAAEAGAGGGGSYHLGPALNANFIRAETGIDVSGLDRTLSSERAWHVLRGHGPNSPDAAEGRAVSRRDIARYGAIAAQAHSVEVKGKPSHGAGLRVQSTSLIGGKTYVISERIGRRSGTLSLVTMFRKG